MKVLIAGDGASPHIRKWTDALRAENVHWHVFSFRPSPFYQPDEITVASGYPGGNGITRKFREWWYFFTTNELKECIRAFSPDIVHAHYASSYGMIARKSGFHPLVISAWGSDIFSFPQRRINRWTLEANLATADLLLSSSRVMAGEMSKYTRQKIQVVPFGVDVQQFRPVHRSLADGKFRVGFVKSLEQIYGLDILIDAIAPLLSSCPQMELHVYGGGSMEAEWRTRAGLTGSKERIFFHGKIHPERVPGVLNELDLFVNPSRRESFGVSIIEAMACGVPVLATDAEGPSEIIAHGETGWIVERENVLALRQGILHLYNQSELRKRLAAGALEKVRSTYDFKRIIASVVADLYIPLLQKRNS